MTLEAGLSLRPETAADESLLRALYTDTRADEMALVPWDAAQREAFLRQQFDAQRAHYRQHYPEARFDVVEYEGGPIGRLYVDRGAEVWLVLDIALLAEFRNKGLGTALMRDVLAGAREAGRPVHLHVDAWSPARRLYDRLGFLPAAENGIHVLMVREPADGP